MLSTFTSWLDAFMHSMWVTAYNNIVDLLQFLFDGVVAFITSLVALFPAGTPVPELDSMPINTTMTALLGALNWLFPISFLVLVSGFITAGIISYLLIAPVARWAKLLT